MTVLDELPVELLATLPDAFPRADRMYEALLVEWKDGDTATVLVDRDEDDLSLWSVRLRGAATRELDEPGGPETREHLARLLPTGTRLVLTGVRDDKYGGRKLARIAYLRDDRSLADLAEALVADGWAMPWDGRGEQPRIPWPREEVIA